MVREGGSFVDVWGKSVFGRGYSRCKSRFVWLSEGMGEGRRGCRFL